MSCLCENNRRKVNVSDIYQLSIPTLTERYLKNVKSFAVIEDGEVITNRSPMIDNYIELIQLFTLNGMDIHSVNGISTFDEPNARIVTLSDGAHLNINLGLARMIKGILSAFEWMHKNKGLDLKRYELEFNYE